MCLILLPTYLPNWYSLFVGNFLRLYIQKCAFNPFLMRRSCQKKKYQTPRPPLKRYIKLPPIRQIKVQTSFDPIGHCTGLIPRTRTFKFTYVKKKEIFFHSNEVSKRFLTKFSNFRHALCKGQLISK